MRDWVNLAFRTGEEAIDKGKYWYHLQHPEHNNIYQDRLPLGQGYFHRFETWGN
jgi:hypothetical protein